MTTPQGTTLTIFYASHHFNFHLSLRWELIIISILEEELRLRSKMCHRQAVRWWSQDSDPSRVTSELALEQGSVYLMHDYNPSS